MISPFLRSSLAAAARKAVKHQHTLATAAVCPEPSTLVKPNNSFYRRPLPESCVAFSSKRGRLLLGQALQEKGLKSYFPLAENFITQSEPAFCGIGSLAMSLNGLGIDPGKTWKGVWRWYDEAMVECCVPLSTFNDGISFEDYGNLARCNGCDAQQWRADESNLGHFRSIVRRVTLEDSASTSSSDAQDEVESGRTSEVLTVAYQRRVLEQTGDGHFSPVGAFVPSEDMVLVMDVARFKYPPHWVPLELLWEAMSSINEWNGRSRGYFLLSKTGNGKSCSNEKNCSSAANSNEPVA